MAERDEFHLSGNELEETRVLIVSQSTTCDGFSSFERVSYEIQQFVRPPSQSESNEGIIDRTEFYSERESFNGQLKRQKIFYKDYQYKQKMPEPKPSAPDFTKGTDWLKQHPTMRQTENDKSTIPTASASLSSFIQKSKDKKFSYTAWKCNLQKYIAGWSFLDTSEYDVIYNQTSNDGLGQKILARTEIDRIDRELTEFEARVDRLESGVQNWEQNIRRNWLILHGVIEKDKEDTFEVVMNIVSEKTGLKMNPHDVENCHRMGRRRYRSNRVEKNNKTQLNKRPIVIKFVNYCKRKDLWDQKKHLRGSGLLLTESLTNQRLELLQKARDRFGEKAVWSQDGRIMYRRPDGSKLRINNNQDLDLISSAT